MPRQSVTIRDEQGRAIGIACMHVRHASCQTSGCSGRATLLCDYPVLRRGKPTTCSRHICQKCAEKVEGKDFCPPHARTWDKDAGARTVTVCASCLTAACWRGELMCLNAGYASITTKSVAELRKLNREHYSSYAEDRR